MNLRVLKDYRAQEENRLQAECIELLRALDRAQERVTQLEADEARQVQAFLANSAAGIGLDEATMARTHLDALASCIANAKDEETALKNAVERKRSDVIEASRERKKLEMLEARRERERRAADERKTQQLMDEVAARRAVNQKGVV